MLRYIYRHDLHQFPQLAQTMYRDRTARCVQPRVARDACGQDSYDSCDPIYVIWEQPDGSHGGSLRFLPSTGPTLINDHFLDLTGGAPLISPLIWECSGICFAAEARVNAALMLASFEVMENFGIAHIAAVLGSAQMQILRGLGCAPEEIATTVEITTAETSGADQNSLGLWEYCGAAHQQLRARAGVDAAQSQRWFDRSFGPVTRGAKLPMSA